MIVEIMEWAQNLAQMVLGNPKLWTALSMILPLILMVIFRGRGGRW